MSHYATPILGLFYYFHILLIPMKCVEMIRGITRSITTDAKTFRTILFTAYNLFNDERCILLIISINSTFFKSYLVL